MSVISIGRLFIWLFIVSPSGESGGENTKYLIEGYEMKLFMVNMYDIIKYLFETLSDVFVTYKLHNVALWIHL